jgi:hypothetical protein
MQVQQSKGVEKMPLLPPRIQNRIGLFHSLRVGEAGERLTLNPAPDEVFSDL